MSSSEDGGPAFPGPFQGHCNEQNHEATCGCYLSKGMTIRDFFASAAMTGILAKGNYGATQNISEMAYKQADYMLDERAKARIARLPERGL